MTTAHRLDTTTAPTDHVAARTSAPARSAPLRVAIVGAGKMGQHHARAIAHLGPLARVVASVDPAPAAREAIEQLCAGSTAYPDLETLFAHEAIDVVHICTAPSTHQAMADAAVAAGCNVYVEKPFVESADGAAQLIDAAQEKGVKLCAGHQLLYESPAREALALLPMLGRIVHVESYFSFRTVRRSPNGRTPLRADLQLLDILPHPVYLLLQFLEAASPGDHAELTALDLGPAGTLHALVRSGAITGNLTVTLEGRPVESYLRVIGTNGAVHADFVRGTVQRLIGPGTSGIDKILNPYRLSRQLLSGTTRALGRRALKRQRSYPGLREIFEAFYTSILDDAPAPMTPEQILETVRIWERVARALEAPARVAVAPTRPIAPRVDTASRVLITGGTGFLGKEVARALAAHGDVARVVARRSPPAWDQLPGVEYHVADVSEMLPTDLLQQMDVVIHCAAATAGGFDEHRKDSVQATERVLRAAAEAGVSRVIHVSSLAVLSAASSRSVLKEDSPLEARGEERGPYVWGKLESERRAVALGKELGITVKIARPGALVDYNNFEPPGRLGKRVGNIFVAVGSPRDALGVADVGFAGQTLAWMATHFDEAPDTLHILAPELPTRRELVSRLRRVNPDLTVLWLPTALLVPLSWAAIGAQKALRPGKPAVNVTKVFASQRYDTALAASVARQVQTRS
ncbi:MAG TPA: Gfo/Idh/MocA family oxidoreductase [Gemmatimonadaceae bacterium]|nr:Gfo/Idh/MocA family oxidoreductase [Gemmatimonadaceae bacterium]